MTRLFSDMDQKRDDAPLPAATRERWQPIRGGLLNLYLYDYEEFRYEKGRLILRGNNGTGKSRVMALQLPFLFDGHLAANRVEPDADPSKRMEWNLLMGRHNERLGYTWIEFGHLGQADKNRNNGEANGHRHWSSSSSENGRDNHCEQVQRFVTLGCGLSATKGSGMREPWFFVTDQRIGEELFLQSEAGHALSKSSLIEAIGDNGRVYATAKEYRQAVDDKLFGLGRQRYDAMVDLLIQLRKPQLSRQLDEKMLAGVLAEALPPPSEQMIIDVAESFRGLESDRMELTRFRSACEGVDSFLKTYRHYAGIASRRRAADVRQSHNRYESASKDLRKVEREHTEAGESLASATKELRSLEIKGEELDSRIETLRADPKMRSADAIRQADDDEKQALSDLRAAEQDLKTASERLGQRRSAQAESFQRAEMQLKSTQQVYERANELAAECDLMAKHEIAFSGVQLQLEKRNEASAGDPRSARGEIEVTTDKRFKSLEQLKKRNDMLTDSEREVAHAKEARDDAQNRVDQAIENGRSAEEQRRDAIDDFLDSYRMWRRDSDELTVPSADDIAIDVDQWSQQIDEASPIANVIRQAELDTREHLNGERLQLEHRVEALAMERSSAEQVAEKLEQGFHEPPPLPYRADEAARAARKGAPFWSLVAP